jgi:hypothetical protein
MDYGDPNNRNFALAMLQLALHNRYIYVISLNILITLFFISVCVCVCMFARMSMLIRAMFWVGDSMTRQFVVSVICDLKRVFGTAMHVEHNTRMGIERLPPIQSTHDNPYTLQKRAIRIRRDAYLALLGSVQDRAEVVKVKKLHIYIYTLCFVI